MSVLFDQASLMERIGHDEHVLRELVEMFLDLQPQRMNELALAVASDDLAAARSRAHTLAGAFRSVSMASLGDLAKALENAASAEDLGECRNVFLELDEAFAHVCEELEALQEGWTAGAAATRPVAESAAVKAAA